MASLAFLISGCVFLISCQEAIELIQKEWPKINQRLNDAGYQIGVSTFFTFVEINLKFAGLFSLIFFLFLLFGLFPAV